jgi:CRISPR-associated endoribonuclease Cas6
MISDRNQDKADKLHEEYDSKPFTISPIIPYLKWKQGKRYLKAGKKSFFRITFLEKEWYNLFMEYFLYNPQLELNKKEVEVIEVLTNAEENPKCNCIKPRTLKEEAAEKRKIKFKFHSTTTFRIEDRHIIFPGGDYLFNSLYSKWQEFGAGELTVEREDFNQLYISRYNLQSAMEQFKDYPLKGFSGECQYELDNNLGKEKVKDINLLADFAFYGGVGYKTTMGLGQVSRVKG